MSFDRAALSGTRDRRSGPGCGYSVNRVVLFLASCNDKQRACRQSPLDDGNRAGLSAPRSDDFKCSSISELSDRHVFLAGLCIHWTDDRRFARSRANSEKDSTMFSGDGSRRRCCHSQLAARLDVVECIDNTITVFQEFTNQVFDKLGLIGIELKSMYIRHIKNASLLTANRMLAFGA
jgi:hypothetical protein